MSDIKLWQCDWVVDEKVMAAVNCGEKHIAMVNSYNDGTDRAVLKDECLANAHLISAAPDMYRALRGLLEAHRHVYGLDGAWDSEVKAAEAALAKADREV